MVTYQPNPVPPLLQAIHRGDTPDAGYASLARQAKLQAEHQARLNEAIAEQRLAHQQAVEAAREAAQQGRYA